MHKDTSTGTWKHLLRREMQQQAVGRTPGAEAAYISKLQDAGSYSE
jgi:hypothetical protein